MDRAKRLGEEYIRIEECIHYLTANFKSNRNASLKAKIDAESGFA